MSNSKKRMFKKKHIRGRRKIYRMMFKLKSKYFLPISIRNKEFEHWEAV